MAALSADPWRLTSAFTNPRFCGVWVEHVELRDVIETVASDISAVLSGHPDLDQLGSRYPGP